jgi:hypothetical protein
VLPRRYTRSDGHSAFTDSERHLILAAETLRTGDTPLKQKSGEKAEEKISTFWRVFGGTILSITALSVISAYQSLANGIHDVRADIGHLREESGNYIKKDEFNNRATTIWAGIEKAQAVVPTVTVLTNKAATLESQLAANDQERKELCRELLALRERLAKLEGQQEVKPAIKSAGHVELLKPNDGK